MNVPLSAHDTTVSAHLPSLAEVVQWRRDPEPLSYSALKTLAACARRWAYGHAECVPNPYFAPQGRMLGVASLGSIRGNVAHRALQDLLGLYVRHGGPPPDTYEIIEFWETHLGEPGLAGLVRATLDAELDTARANPRNRLLLSHFERQAPRLVDEVTRFVHERIPTVLRAAHAGGLPARTAGPVASAPSARYALGPGNHAEVRVEAALADAEGEVRWKGQIDAVCIEPGGVTLVDYKTGLPEAEHREQLEIYALLFARDPVANPASLRATRLLLAYRSGATQSWQAPGDAALVDAERALLRRSRALLPMLQAEPPAASPGPDVCAPCGHRGHCDAYWARKSLVPSPSEGADLVDLEVVVSTRSPNGDRLEGVTAPRPGQVGASVRLLVHEAQRAVVRQIDPARRIRFLGVRALPLSTDKRAGAAPVFELGWFSEIVCVS